MNHQRDNPYVGPRTFTREESHLFFGREREARGLLSLVISERLVLFYAQSGGGKSSMINTRLIPGLEAKGFEVLQIGRVSGALPPGTKVDNIFVYNLLLSLNQREDEDRPLPDPNITLKDFLREYDPEEPVAGDYDDDEIWPRALIIDQFEEIVTTNLQHWKKREDFFVQLREAMEDDDHLWVVLSMREDYVGGLDPYVHLLPGKLRARFYMQRMGFEAALEAVRRPVYERRPFAEGVAEKLVNNLRQIRIRDHGESPEPIIGEYIKPVQLQVVCYQLWENLKKDEEQTEITDKDLKKLAGGEDLAQFVDEALAQFYEQAIAQVIEDKPGRTEFALRDWFENKLITTAKTRALVNQEAEETGGMDNDIVKKLEDLFLLRAESRVGSRWYELVHDRFIDPILQANADWRQDHPLIQDALEWKNAGEVVGKLYQGSRLAEAQKHTDAKVKLVREFLEAGRKAEKQRELAIRAEEEKKRADELAKAAQRMRLLASGLFVVFLLAVVAAMSAISSGREAVAARKAGEAAALAGEATAVAGEATAVAALRAENEAERIANAQSLARAALDSLSVGGDPDLSVLYAIKAARLSISGTAYVIEAHDALNQALQNVASSSPHHTLYGHSGEVVSVAFNGEGTLLATAGKDSTAIVWDSLTGEVQQTLGIFDGSDGITSQGFPIAFDRDGNLAAVSPYDGTSISVWRIDTGAEIKIIPTDHSDTIWSIAFSPDGQYLATADRSGVLEIWDVASNDRLWQTEAHSDGISGVAFSPDSLLVATASKDATVKIWDVLLGNEEARLDDHTGWVNQIAFIDDGSQVVTASDDGTAKLWDFASGADPIDLPESYDTDIRGIAFSQAEGKPRLAMVNDKGTVMILDKDVGTNAWVITSRFSGHSDAVWDLALSQDGTRLATVSSDSTTVIWSLGRGGLHPIIPISEEPIYDLIASSEGRYLASVRNYTGSIQLLGFTDHTRMVPTQTNLGITVTQFTPFVLSADGRRLATVDDDVPQVWDISSVSPTVVLTLPRSIVQEGTTEQQTDERDDEIIHLALNQDGTRLAVEGLETGLKVWDVETRKVVFTLDVPNWGTALAFSPDSFHLARANTDFDVNVWDIDSGERLFTFSPEQTIVALTFNDDGSLLATADTDNNIRVWQVDSVEHESVTFLGSEAISALTFDYDSSHIIAAGDAGTVCFYGLDIDELLDVACQYTSRNLTWSEWQSHQREIGEEPEDSLICDLPIDSSIVEELVRQEEEGIEKARNILKVAGEQADEQIAQILLVNSEQHIGQGRYADAFWSLEQATGLYPELRSTQPVSLATVYYQVCHSWRDFSFVGDVKTSCEQAVGLAAETDDLLFNFEICQYNIAGSIEEFDVSPVCDRVVDLATKTEDASLSLDVCLQGIDAGLDDFVEPICIYALEQPGLDQILPSYLGSCRTGGSRDSEALFSSVCQRLVETVPRIEVGQRVQDVVESSEGDYWAFAGTEGQYVSIAMGGFDTFLELWEPDSLQTIMEDDDGGDGVSSNSLIQGFRLPKDGLYVINAYGYGGYTGTYHLILTEEVPRLIALGDIVSENISDQSLWTFEGERGQIVSIAMDTTDADFDPYLTLLEPGGWELFSDDNSGGNLNARIQDFILPEEGHYLIKAGRVGTFADYTLALTEGVPQEIALGDTVSENIADQSLWAFEGKRGQIISIGMDTTDADFDPYLTLLGRDGRELFSNDDSGGTQNARIQGFILPEDGRYLIKAGRAVASADYTLSLTEQVPQPIDFGEREIDDTIGVTAWTFAGAAGQVVMIRMDEVDSDQEVDLTLLGSGGEKLSDRVSSLIVDLPEAGSYTIFAQGYPEDGARYILSLREITEELGSLIYGSTVSGEIVEASTDYWAFAGNAGEAAKIAIESSSFDLRLELYNPNGALIGEYDTNDPIRGDLSRLMHITGTHIIAVSGVDDGQSGSYTLSLTQTDILPVLAWTAYTDMDEEYAHVLGALSRLAPSVYEVTETDTTDEGILRSALMGHSVFLIPEQEQTDSATLAEIGSRFGPILEEFIRQGGRVISLGEWGDYEGFLRAMGLLDASYTAFIHPGAAEIVTSDSPVAQGLPTRIDTEDATASYRIADVDATIVVEAESGGAVVVTRSIGLGQVVLIGYDYYESNDDADQLLVNAVFWPR